MKISLNIMLCVIALITSAIFSKPAHATTVLQNIDINYTDSDEKSPLDTELKEDDIPIRAMSKI